jgi:hypothetical protein
MFIDLQIFEDRRRGNIQRMYYLEKSGNVFDSQARDDVLPPLKFGLLSPSLGQLDNSDPQVTPQHQMRDCFVDEQIGHLEDRWISWLQSLKVQGTALGSRVWEGKVFYNNSQDFKAGTSCIVYIKRREFSRRERDVLCSWSNPFVPLSKKAASSLAAPPRSFILFLVLSFPFFSFPDSRATKINKSRELSV